MLTAVILLATLAQELQVRAVLEPRTVRAGEPAVFRITVEIRGRGTPDIPRPELPAGVSIVGTRDATSTSITVPGGRTTSLVREFVLLAADPGQYPIPALRIELDGQVRRTLPLTLTVTRAPPGSAVRDAALSVRMQPETVYVGQQATLVAEIQLATELQMRLARPPVYEMPAPAEFWVQELPPEPHIESVVRDNQRFNVQRYGRAYFPLTAGKFAFAPVRVSYEARQGFVFAPQTVELRSQSPRVVVLPLPAGNRPADFRGAVGRFAVSTILDARNAAVGDGVTLTMVVEGEGNIKALPPPLLPPIPNVSVLDPAETTEITPAGRRVRGHKRFTWVIVPEKPGAVSIPPIRYVFFDPLRRAYVAETSGPLSFEVAASAAEPAGTSAGLRARPATDALAFTRTRWFALGQLIPLSFLVLAWLTARSRAGPSRAVQRGWKRRADALVASADPCGSAEQLLRDVLFTISPEPVFKAGSVSELAARVRALLGDADGDEVVAILQRCADARYSNAPLPDSERREISRRVDALLPRLWAHARGSARSSLLILLIGLQSPEQLFRQGVSAFHERDVKAAAVAFERYTALRPDDPNGWYNLAIVRQSLRLPASSAWAMLRAAELEPRSRTIANELRRARVEELGRRVRSLTSLTPTGLRLVLAGLWWLACLLLASTILTRRRLFAGLAIAPLLAAGTLAAVTLVEAALPPPAIVLDQGANLQAGRNLHAETLRQLQPLTGLSIMEEADGWLRVRTADGEEGWVREESIGKL